MGPVNDTGQAGAAMNETGLPEGLEPVRALLFARNRRGQAVGLTTLKKWLRVAGTVYQADKADIIIGADDSALMADLTAFARDERMRLSARVAPDAPPPSLKPLAEAGLLDLFLCPARPGKDHTEAWLRAASEAGLGVRVQVHGGMEAPEVRRCAELLRDTSLVNVAYHDPFVADALPWPVSEAPGAVRQLNEFAAVLHKSGIPSALLGLPFCHVDGHNLALAVNAPQFFLDCRNYQRPAYELAGRLYRLGPNRIDKVLENLLARRTSVHNAIDASLLPWLMDYPQGYIRVWMLHKITRHLRFLRRRPRPLGESVSAWEAELGRYREAWRRKMGPVCSECRFRRICDHATEPFRHSFPSLGICAVPGDLVVDPNQFRRDLSVRLDEMDRARIGWNERHERLAEEARHVTTRETPTREITTDSYDILGRYTHHMPGAVRWLSFGPGELESTPLARLEPPFTLSLTVGGGIAEQVGFSFGRFAKIVCPMVDYSHRLTLHVDAEGCYVLLRDDRLVRPTEFEGERSLPPRLSGMLEPRISLHNIDGMILTQTLLLWEGAQAAAPRHEGVKYSVIIISTRYTRRLQAALLMLAHQQGVDPGLFEVVVGYVPGIDATDDLLDGMRDAFPQLRIVRSPFSEGNVRAKGFMINESVTAASGEWILLMDADILPPPDVFARMEELPPDAHFVAPDGRKMLSPETTSRVLLGEVRPWECYDELLESPGEIRYREADGIPIGFFQCIRRDILKRVPYHELDHFESSDWLFGRDAGVHYGREIRLPINVLHLDHSGSQWYGTSKQR